MESIDTKELTGNAFLKEDQPFYDQPPFNTVFNGIVDKYGIEIKKLRYLFFHLSRNFDQSRALYLTGKVTSNTVAEKLTNLHPHQRQIIRNDLRKLGEPVEGDQKYVLSLGELGRIMDQYPYWYEYIILKMSSDYKIDGSLKESNRPKAYIPTESYISFVQKEISKAKLRRDSQATESAKDSMPGSLDFRNRSTSIVSNRGYAGRSGK